MGDLSGYRGPSLKALEAAGVAIGDVVRLDLDGQPLTGTLAPRYQHDDDSHVVVRLKNGYNIGLSVSRISHISKVEGGQRPAFTSTAPTPREELPQVAILGTGGTIASRVEYRTGAVHPAISSEDLYSLMPELAELARIRPEIVLSISSEDMEPSDWGLVADEAARFISEGSHGVVVTTGTDVMGYTSAALAFALGNTPVPVFVVGSQRSSDRPSSDAYLNLVGAVSMAASAEFSGVYLVMHADTSDERLSVHGATRVRKNHTSARNAFESIGVPPVAYWTRSGIESHSPSLPPRRRAGKMTARSAFEKRVALVKFYPSMPPSSLEGLLGEGTRGLIIEGTGLGHVNRKSIEVLKRFADRGGLAFMTSQCIWGRVDMNVYANGRDLLRAGVVPLEDMLAETALVKLMWALANHSSPDAVVRFMRENVAGEMTDRSLPSRSS